MSIKNPSNNLGKEIRTCNVSFPQPTTTLVILVQENAIISY